MDGNEPKRLPAVPSGPAETTPSAQGPSSAEAAAELLALRAEVRELRAKLHHQDAILRSAEGFIEFDPQFRMVYVNDAAEQLLGRSRKQLLGKDVWEEFPGTLGSDVERNYRRVLTERVRICFEHTSTQPGKVFAIAAHPSLAGGIFAWVRDISAQKAAEAARERALTAEREVAAELDAIVASAPIGIALLDRELRYLRINDALAAMNGPSAAEHLGRTAHEIIPETVQSVQPMVSQVLEQGVPSPVFEYSALVAGREVCVLTGFYPVRVGTAVVGLAVVALDVTARWRAERGAEILARASGAFMSLDVTTALQAVTEAVVPFVADGCVVGLLDESGNRLDIAAIAHRDAAILPVYQKLWEAGALARSEGTGPWQVVRSGASTQISCLLDEMQRAPPAAQQLLPLVHASQIHSWMAVPLAVSGHTIGVLSLSRTKARPELDRVDQALAEELAQRATLAIERGRLNAQTLREQARAELAANRMTRLQAFTAALGEAVTVQQIATAVTSGAVAALGAIAGTVAILNDEGTEFTLAASVGYPSGVVDRWQRFPVTVPLPIGDAIRLRELIVLADRAARVAKYPIMADVPPNLDAGAWVALPILHGDRALGALGMNFAAAHCFDEPERALMMTIGRQAAVALERARLFAAEAHARAAAQSANQAKDEFLATVSHELRTPLNAILGWAYLLRKPKLSEEKRERALVTIERSARAQSKLIDDLLDLSRIISGKLTLQFGLVDPLTAIEAALDGIRPAAEAKRVQLQAVLAPDVGLIVADADRVQQIAWNLLTNAVKFTPSGGVVTVRLTRQDDEVELQVADTGVGILPEFLPLVFERFTQADTSIRRAQGGLGLGLAITRHIVELHHGRITAYSAGADQGAVFTVRIAVAPVEALAGVRAPPAAIAPDTYPAGLAGLRVVVVDDELDARELVAELLQRGQAKVTLAASAAEAFDLVVRDLPDVLISDIGMPGEDGYSLLRRVRALPPEQGGCTPAIALTAYASSEEQKQALCAGYNIHLPKPIEQAELIAVLARWGRQLVRA